MAEPQDRAPPARACVYGAPLPDLAPVPPGAVQTSPLIPGSTVLETIEPQSLASAVVAAPAGTLERDAVLALTLRALQPGGRLTATAPKDKGGARLNKTLTALGCTVEETGRRHHRICHAARPERLAGLDEAVAGGALRQVDGVGWTQPGVFSWDRPDPGSVLLAGALGGLSERALAGRAADLGCGVGLLARTVLARPSVTQLHLLDVDRRAIEAARRNVGDPRASFHWADVRHPPSFGELDFVVTNPPFHHAGEEDRDLGRAFIKASHGLLRPGGAVWLVANRHLPYEALLNALFASVTLRVQDGGFKVYEARR